MSGQTRARRTSGLAWLAGMGMAVALVAAPAPAAVAVPPPAAAPANSAGTASADSGTPGRIAFVSDRDGNHEIYTMNADGSDPIRLTNHPDADLHPAWSPDGTRIAFTRYSNVVLPDGTTDRNADVYLMNADGSALTNLTASATVLELDPAWSPDGSRLAFVRSAGTQPRIWAMNSDGSGQTPLTTDEDQPGDLHPRWSPDGQRVLFDRIACGVGGVIHAVTTDGTATVSEVTERDGRVHVQPGTAPDGARIAYQSIRVGGTAVECAVMLAILVGTELTGSFIPPMPVGSDEPRIVVADPDGTDPTSHLTGGPPAFNSALAWAPDNAAIAFARATASDQTTMDLYTIDLASGVQTSLTSSPRVNDHSPDWSPRGCTISGTPGNDVLRGTDGPDVICALAGNDVVHGGAGDDVLLGGDGADVIQGQDGDDVLLGGPGNDVLLGQNGSDTATGGPGFDYAGGGNGADTLDTVDGTGGNDVADGGNGTDSCAVDAGPPADFKISCP